MLSYFYLEVLSFLAMLHMTWVGLRVPKDCSIRNYGGWTILRSTNSYTKQFIHVHWTSDAQCGGTKSISSFCDEMKLIFVGKWLCFLPIKVCLHVTFLVRIRYYHRYWMCYYCCQKPVTHSARYSHRHHWHNGNNTQGLKASRVNRPLQFLVILIDFLIYLSFDTVTEVFTWVVEWRCYLALRRDFNLNYSLWCHRPSKCRYGLSIVTAFRIVQENG